MFIVFSSDTLTMDAKAFLSAKMNMASQPYWKLKLNDMKDEKLIVLDFSASNIFQDKVAPKAFVDYLIESGLPAQVKTIDLWMSDVIFEQSLYCFGHDVANYFNDHYQRDVTVHIPTEVNVDYTLVVPPVITKGEWEVYGIQDTDIAEKKTETDFAYLYQQPKKILIWHGEDLNNWLSEPGHICEFRQKKILRMTRPALAK